MSDRDKLIFVNNKAKYETANKFNTFDDYKSRSDCLKKQAVATMLSRENVWQFVKIHLTKLIQWLLIVLKIEKRIKVGSNLQAEKSNLETQKVEAYKEVFAKVNEIITEIYNKHIFDNNDLNDEECDAVINFSDDITYKLGKLKEEMTGEDNEPSSM